MSRTAGDESKQPEECKALRFKSDCPNMKSVSESWDDETFRCAVCGAGYVLYDDEMK